MPTQFDILSEVYDAMINWEKRLANEAPFYRRIFEETHARTVLDAACGTGRHAAMFASWGLDVEGADISDEMLQTCRKQQGGHGIRWVARSFTQTVPTPADVVVCAGNSLALTNDLTITEQAIAALAGGARAALMIHVVNLFSRPDGPIIWDKSRKIRASSGDYLVNKGIHRSGSRGYVDFVLAPLGNASAEALTRCVEFIGLEADWVRTQLSRHGFGRIEVFSDYAGSPFDAAHSPDLLAVAFRN